MTLTNRSFCEPSAARLVTAKFPLPFSEIVAMADAPSGIENFGTMLPRPFRLIGLKVAGLAVGVSVAAVAVGTGVSDAAAPLSLDPAEGTGLTVPVLEHPPITNRATKYRTISLDMVGAFRVRLRTPGAAIVRSRSAFPLGAVGVSRQRAPGTETPPAGEPDAGAWHRAAPGSAFRGPW